MPDGKKPGLVKKNALNRKEGNFEPKVYYDDRLQPSPLAKVKTSKNKKLQSSSIKILNTSKNEIAAIKLLNNTKFDYEVIQFLIDKYISSLPAQEYKKYKMLLEVSNFNNDES